MNEYIEKNYTFSHESTEGSNKFKSVTKHYFRVFTGYEIWLDCETNYWGGRIGAEVILHNPIPTNNIIFNYPSMKWVAIGSCNIEQIEAKVAKIIPLLKECVVEIS